MSRVEFFGSSMRELVALVEGRALDNGIDPATGKPFEEKPAGRPITPDMFGPDGKFRPPKDGE